MGGTKCCPRKGPAYFITLGDSALVGLCLQQPARAIQGGEGHLIKVISWILLREPDVGILPVYR